MYLYRWAWLTQSHSTFPWCTLPLFTISLFSHSPFPRGIFPSPPNLSRLLLLSQSLREKLCNECGERPEEAGAGSLFTCPRHIYSSSAEACGDTVTTSDFWIEPEAPPTSSHLPSPFPDKRNAAHWVKRCQTLSRHTLFHCCVSVFSLFSATAIKTVFRLAIA